MRVLSCLRLAPLLLLAAAVAPAREFTVVVASAELDRAGQVAAFPLPENAPAAPFLRDAAGRRRALQVEADRTARFVIPRQKAGEALSFTLAGDDGAAPSAPGVSVARDGGDLRLRVAGRPVLHFRMDREIVPRTDIKPEIVRAGYVHPVFSPAGQIVTDDYPSNHPHHHGIWTPWTKTSFQGRAPDFWNMHAKTGAEDFAALDRTWDGAVHGGFAARLKMIDRSAPAPIVALDVRWLLTAYAIGEAAPAVHLFDLVVTQTCATSDPLILPEYHYGGFGFRGAGAWNGPGEAARFLTSEGISDRIAGNNTRARWCYLGGPGADGALAGTATLGHPENFRSPQPVRLHPNMPYFSFVPQQLGAFRIEPGRPYVARYRFVVADGPPDRAQIDAYWNAFAHTAKITVTPR